MQAFPRISVSSLIIAGQAELKTGPFGTQLKASEYTEEGTPVINVRNIGMGSIKPDKLEYISDSTRDRLSSHVLRSGDIVFGRKGAVERHVFIRQEQHGWFQGSDCLRLRLSSPKVEPLFASYFFQTTEHQSWMMNQCSHGATMSSLNQEILERIEIPNPPIEVQRRIAGILAAYDELIENNQRRIRILEDMARSLYREWFVHYRYPGHESVPLVDSAFEQIPQGWEVKKVAELLAKVSRQGKIKTQDYLQAGELPVIDQGRELVGGYTNDADVEYSGELPVIVFGDHTRILKFIDFPFACGADGTQLLRSNDERMPVSLFYYTLSAIELSDFAYARHFKFLKEELVVVPIAELATAFSERVDPIKRQVRVLQQQSDNLHRARDLLLPRLLSGQVSVS
ncbi:MAG: restriction endonuclease subunit S [Gallionella sp.]|jgi:type I restriction enzyme S subunit